MTAYIEYTPMTGSGQMEIYTEFFFPVELCRLRKLKKKVIDICYNEDMKRDFVNVLRKGIHEKRGEVVMERQKLCEDVRDGKLTPGRAEKARKSIESSFKKLDEDEREVMAWQRELQA